MIKSRFKFVSCLISFVLIFTVFSYFSPLSASSERDIYYYYDTPTKESTQSKKTNSLDSQHNNNTAINTSNDDDDDAYEVFIVKVKKEKKLNNDRRALTFSQMATAINKKQHMRRVSKRSITQFNTNTHSFF